MARVAGRELVLERGEGVWLWDEGGTRYLDGTAGLWFCNVGHGRRELARAAADQMTSLAAHHIFGRFANRPAIELAECLAALAPFKDAMVFLTSGGSEAVDTAVKLVRRYWDALGRPERQIVISREGGYHGTAGYGTSISGLASVRHGYGELAPSTILVERFDVDGVAAALEANVGRVAAFVGELVQGSAGVYPAPAGYWPAVEKLCRAHDVLLVLDEVVTAMGRMGHWFASERAAIVPDLVVGAKAVTSGYVPLGFVLASSRVAEPFRELEGAAFDHGYTFSGHATASAVALENLAILEREALLDRALRLEAVLSGALDEVRDHAAVAEVRHTGMLAGVELATEVVEACGGDAATDVVAAALQRGVILRPLHGRTVAMSPPLVIDESQIVLAVSALLEGLDCVCTRL